jgi:hypothetical protein
MRVFGNGVLRRIFGHQEKEIRGVWKRIHNKELSALLSSLSYMQVIK